MVAASEPGNGQAGWSAMSPPHTSDSERPKTAVVVPCHNEKNSVLRFLSSLSDDSPLHVVLVDDGSSDGVCEAVRASFPAVQIVRGDGSLWWSGAINEGIRAALMQQPVHIAVFNNDCVLPPGAVSALVKRLAGSDRTIVSATISDLETGEPVSYGGRFGKTGLEYWESPPPLDPDGLATVDWLPGHALLMPAGIFAEIGTMDATAFPHYWGDSDFTLRAKRSGYRLAVDIDVHVANDRSQTGLRMRTPVRPRNLWDVLTSQRSWLRVSDNGRFWWRHRDVVSARRMLFRYAPIPIAVVAEILDHLRLRSVVRRLRRTP